MRTFNRELNVAKLNVLKTQESNLNSRVAALEAEMVAVKVKAVEKAKQIAELEAKLTEAKAA